MLFKIILRYVAYFVYLFFLVEGSFYLIYRNTWFTFSAIPDYNLTLYQPIKADINSVWGDWNYAKVAKQNTACSDVTIHHNTFGMRYGAVDKKTASPRIVCLGDSYLWGFGIEEGQRWTDILEKDSGVPYLNFGCPGHNPLQYFLVYKQLASQFSHDAVIVSLYPANDFDDMNFSLRELGPYKHLYRPFLGGIYPHYLIQYPFENLEDSPAYYKKIARSRYVFSLDRLKFYLQHLTFTYNFLLSLKSRHHDFYQSGYWKYSKEDLNRLTYCLENLKKISGERPILVITFPSKAELVYYQKVKQKPPLPKDLQHICEKTGVLFFDLFDELTTKTGENPYYLKCNSHWSAEGNRHVAMLLSKNPALKKIIARIQ